MASSSLKKIASKNLQTLKELHTASLLINLLVLFLSFIFGRPQRYWVFLLFSAPAFLCEYSLERNGRPKFDGKTLVKSGDDLKGQGLYEYMFDCIYITWFCDVLMMVTGSNKVWLILGIIPTFFAVKLWGIALPFLTANRSSKQDSNANNIDVKDQKLKPTTGKKARNTRN